MSFRLVLGLAVVAAATVALVLAREGRAPRGTLGGGSSADETGPASARSRLLPPAQAAERSAAPERVEEQTAVRASNLESLLGRLREIAPARDYHQLAWPVLESIARLDGAGEPIDERLEHVAHGTEGDGDRVRSGCVVALALRRSSGAQALAEGLVDRSSPEVERASWIALGLLASGGEGMPVALDRFEHSTGLRTYPASIERCSTREVLARALRRLSAPVPEHIMEVSLEPEGNQARFEEQFTRCVVVLAILGPAVVADEDVRATLLQWLRGLDPPLLAEEAVLHCLALAAARDEELAAQVLEIAAARLFEPEGAGILEALVRLGGRGAEVLVHLRGFFAAQEALAGDPLFALAQAQALAALMPLLGSQDAALRAQASALALERLTDPGLDPLERQLFLTTLATQRSDLLLEVVQALTDGAEDEELLRDAISFLDAVSAEDRGASQALLLALLDREGAGVDLRLALIREIAQVNAPGTAELLLTLRSMEQDPAVRALLDQLIGGDG